MLKGKSRQSKNLITKERQRLQLINNLKIFLLFKKILCVLFVTNKWMDSATPHAKYARKVYIPNVLKFGQGTKKIPTLQLLVQCVDQNSKILWWSSSKILKDGKPGFQHIKVHSVKAVVWKISKGWYISVSSVIIQTFVNSVFKVTNIASMIVILLKL